MSTPVPFNDGDPAWQTFSGTVRFRVAGNTGQIQVSAQNVDGVTFDVTTIVLPGAYVRDTRKGSVTPFPSYTSAGLPTNFRTSKDQMARQQGQVGGRVGVPSGPPINRSDRKADGFPAN